MDNGVTNTHFDSISLHACHICLFSFQPFIAAFFISTVNLRDLNVDAASEATLRILFDFLVELGIATLKKQRNVAKRI
jgi:hydrogenase maturation factor HypE